DDPGRPEEGRCGRGRQGSGRRPQPRDIEDATGHPGVHPRIAQSPRGGAGTQMTTRRGRRWSLDVTTKSNALDLEANVFTRDDPKTVARSLKQSAERSHRRKSDPYRSAMSMLTFYINRAGKTLSRERKDRLERAKEELRAPFGKRPGAAP